MTPKWRRRLAPLLLFSAAFSQSSQARANGAFPSVSQIVADPEDPAHLYLRSTFGVVLTQDGGANWDWICESAAGYINVEPPMTVLAGGRVILALPRGISRSANGACEFSAAQGIEADVVDVSRDASAPARVVALSVTDVDSRVWESNDSGASFSELGAPFDDVRATTLDVAASDPDVLYVSGVRGGAQGGGEGILLRSDDRGQSFEAFGVPATNSGKKPYIAAVDPHDDRTVYVRTTGIPGRLFVTRDGGKSFDEALVLTVPIQGFALSPDGGSVLATNVYDGSYRADTDTLRFEKIACRGPSCLVWNEAGLFGCGDDLGDGFIVGRSRDLGATFERVVNLSCIRGPLACDASTIVGSECPTYWPTIRTQLGADECAPPEVPPYAGCLAEGGAGGENGAGTSASGTGGSDGDAGASDVGGTNSGSAGVSAAAGRAGSSSGCGLSIISYRNHWGFLTTLGWGLLFFRRRATRGHGRTTSTSS